nr:myb/SANT-like DNA-binding domain-containing protein 2 [Caretta caretta]
MQCPPSQATKQSRIHRRAPAWSEREVLDLITCWGDESVMAELRSKKRNANTYTKVSKAMTERGYSRDTEQCRTKIKALRQAYQKAREANGHSGSQPPTCCFYCELHAIMGGDATTTPPLSVDNCKGRVARSEEDAFLENEEEEDSAQAASGESVFPPNQELFLTLEPIVSPIPKACSRTMTLEKALLQVQMFQRGLYLLRPRRWSIFSCLLI